MLTFTKVRFAIIHDLTPICVNHYFILKTLNLLPQEVNLIIAYHILVVSNEMVNLENDIIHMDKIIKLCNMGYR